MDHPLALTIAAIFLWWFFTGVILIAVRWADRQGGAAHGMVVLAGVPFLALGVAGVITSLPGTSVAAVYAGFLGALAIWGWIELAFLAGIVTGPERRPCPPGLTGSARFLRAWNTVAHHELALALGLFAIVAMSSGADNKVALWTYLILWVARVSAKLNLFFGVPRINVEFVPARLDHIKGYFRQGQVTPLFPLAITFLTFATGCFIERLIAATDPVSVAAHTLLAALAALALLEHWLMVLPLPDAKLWRWMLAEGRAPRSPLSSDHRRKSPR
jgi:putative photosynthetic complex assembly protein 2